jgi:hypothetical protein
MSQVSVILAINGNNQMTNSVQSESFDIDKKFEYEFSDLNPVDGYISLPVSKLIPFTKIIATSDNQLKIKVTSTSGITENYISGVAYISLDPTYASTINNVSIATDMGVNVNGTISLIKLV